MFDRLIQRAEDSAARTARKAALGLGAGIFMVVGVGFLTVAAWMLISALLSPLHAATIIGATFLGVGLILVGFAASKTSDTVAPEPKQGPSRPAEEMLPQMVAAFMSGIQAGRQARS